MPLSGYSRKAPPAICAYSKPLTALVAGVLPCSRLPACSQMLAGEALQVLHFA